MIKNFFGSIWKILKVIFSIRNIFVFLILSAISLFGILLYMYNQVRFEAYKLIDYSPKLTTQVFDRNGELVANIFDSEHRLYASYEEIPVRVVEALVAIEDTSFFEHGGISYEGIFRAMIKNIKNMRFSEGASTLTQQLVKNTILTPEKKIKRKIYEALLSYKIESVLTKEQIIERYLNHVYFGHGYYGVKTAAKGYFRKNLDELSLKETVMLAGLPQAPSSYDPTKHLDLSLARANAVLIRMKNLGWIEEMEYLQAISEVPVIYDDTLTLNKAPYVIDEVIKQLLYISDLKTGGYKIKLGVDMQIQKLAEEALNYGYENIKARNNEHNHSLLNGAMIVTQNQTGEVLALVGGVDYSKSHFNRVTQSKRQLGSSIKPFIYQKALDMGYSTMSLIPDISRVYTTQKENEEWKPKNYEGNFKGLITLKEALIRSRNLATINLLSELGLETVYKDLSNDGFEKLPRDLTMALGNFSVSPLEANHLFSMFANYGEMVKPILITSITDKFDQKKEFKTERKYITDPEQAFLTLDILKNAVLFGTGRSARVPGIDLAGKTGTTNDNVDAWFCGITPDFEAVVWYGNDNNTPMPSTEAGGRTAGSVFGKFVKEYISLYPETTREFFKPDGVKETTFNGQKTYFTDRSPLPLTQEPQVDSEGGLIF